MQIASPGSSRASIERIGARAGEAGALPREVGVRRRSVVEMDETERRRIAREIHDVVGQALTAVRLSLVAARASGDRDAVDRRLDESVYLIELAMDQVRAIARDLRPAVLDDLGLAAAVRGYLADQAVAGRFEPTLRILSLPRRLQGDVETACFRIVQEAVTNIQRHAFARHVEVELEHRDDKLDLRITDDGRGFDVRAALGGAASRGGLGLIGMHERALLVGGDIAFHSQPGRGTEIRARLPAKAHAGA